LAALGALRAPEADGLVERVPDPDDRRSLLVGLTRRGRALVDRIVPSMKGVKNSGSGPGLRSALELIISASRWRTGSESI
jgi:DNA-binding MarR family transcriptional regulator